MLIVLYVIKTLYEFLKTMYDIYIYIFVCMCVRYAVNQCLPILWE